MRRRKNIIVSAITCMFSLCLMMIGVYATSSPSVSINGQVSYTARDASVLVQGKTYGADGYETGEYKEITDPTSPKTSDVLTNSVSQYLDYTSADQNKTTLATWDLGNQLKFYEDQNGIRKVYVYLKFTNLSNYPITASAKFESKTATNVKTTQSPSDGKMAMTTVGNVGSDCEMSFAFEVEDDSKNASIDFTLVITIEKTVLQSYTATFSSGTKQFTNQSNATSYNVNEATVLEEAPELYFSENGGERRVAYWYDNSECQGEPIKFPYVLSGNKTFYSAWEQNTKIFNFFDWGNDVQVYFDGYPAFRTQSLKALASMTESGLENYGDSITAAGETFIVIHSKNIVGFQAYNNLTYDVSNKSFYIIPGYTLEQLNQKIKNNEYQELFSLLVGGYAFQGNQILEGSVVETRFVATSKVIAPNVRIFESGKEMQSQVGFNPTNRMSDLQKYDLTLNSGSEYKFITGGEDNTSSTYVTAETLTFQMPVFTKLASANVYSSVGEKTTGSGDKLYVAEWYDNAELSGQPISLPYTLSKDTTLYAKWEYNRKEYTIAPTAKNVELWVRGRKVLKVKDLSAFLGEKDTMETCYEFVASNGDVYGAVVNFKESESLEYVDKNFKMMAVMFFSCQFYTQDWNVFEWSDVNQDSILTCVDTFFSMGQNNNVIEISMGHYDGLDCLKDDDLKVYVDGVEANYTWTRCVYD